MPRFVAALVALAFLAGCGGPDIAYTEVDAPPENIPIPEDVGPADIAEVQTDEDGNVTTGKPSPTPGSTTTDPTTGTTVAPPETTDTTTTTPPETAPVPVEPVPEEPADDTTGGAAPPSAPEPDPSGGTGGATADEGLDQFCADNPGACNG